MDIKNLKNFDKDFLWGASISAFQAEGAYNKDGRGLSVMDLKNYEGYANFNDAADFYHRYKDDIKLFKELGLKSLRFSISWTRIYPNGDGAINQKGLDFYHSLIDELLKHGIEPIVTIYHFDLPLSLEERGGWSNQDLIIDAFFNYATTLFDQFGHKVKYWITFNEQNVMIMLRTKNPFINENEIHRVEKTKKEIYQQSHNMFIAQALVVDHLHQTYPNSVIGPALNIVPIYPNSNHPNDYLAAMNGSIVRNWYYLDAIVRGEYNPIMKTYLEENDCLPEFKTDDLNILKRGKPDFIAVNYYTSSTAKSTEADEQPFISNLDQQKIFDINGMYTYCDNANLKDTEYGWGVDPVGLRSMLREVYERYRIPLMITENGIGRSEVLNQNNSVNDNYRIHYYRQHILEIQKAISEGIEIISYNPWTALDIVSSHQGFKKRYGFIYVDRDEEDLKEMKRYPKKSFYWYQQVITSNGKNL